MPIKDLEKEERVKLGTALSTKTLLFLCGRIQKLSLPVPHSAKVFLLMRCRGNRRMEAGKPFLAHTPSLPITNTWEVWIERSTERIIMHD